jgi:hypothetical protein
MIGRKYYFGLRVQSVCRNFSFRMEFKIGGSRVQYVQYVQKKIPFRMAISRWLPVKRSLNILPILSNMAYLLGTLLWLDKLKHVRRPSTQQQILFSDPFLVDFLPTPTTQDELDDPRNTDHGRPLRRKKGPLL